MAMLSSASTTTFTARFDPANPIGFVDQVFEFFATASDFLWTETAEAEIAAAVKSAKKNREPTAVAVSGKRLRESGAGVAEDVKEEEKCAWRGMEMGSCSQNSTRASKRDRRVWTPVEENALLEALEELVTRGMRANNGSFRPGYMSIIEKSLEAKCPSCGLKGNPHIESKMKNMKRLYYLINDIKEQSGFSWNPDKHCIDVDSGESWQAYCKREPYAAGLRGRSLPHYYRLDYIFGKNQFRGNPSEDSAEANIILDRDNGSSPFVGFDIGITTDHYQPDAPQKNRPKTDQEFTNLINSVFEKVNERLDMIGGFIGQEKSINEEKRRVVEELLGMGLSIEQCIPLGRKILKDAEDIHLFFGFKGENRRAFVNWLLREMKFEVDDFSL